MTTTAPIAPASRSGSPGGSVPAAAPLRVLIALPGLHRVSRGAEIALESVGAHLCAAPGIDVTLVGSGPQRSGRPYRFLSVPCTPRERFERWPKIPPFRSEYVYEEATFAPRLGRVYDPRDYDVTVTCAYPFTNWLLRAKGRKAGRPAHVFITQNGDWPARARNSEFRCFGCDGMVCTNPEYYERHKAAYRCALIPNGVDTDRFTPGPPQRARFAIPEGVPVVLIVSALIESKRVADGIAAAARVPGVHVVVAGDGPERERIEQAGRELLGNRFQRILISHDRIPDLYRSADCLLHMSRDEPFGNIYLEAMACGLPVVAHDSLNSRWIIGEHGTRVDTSDLEAVAQAISRTLAEQPPGAAESRHAMVAARFAWPIVAASYAAFLREIAARRTSAGAPR